MNNNNSPFEYLISFLVCVGIGYMLARGKDRIERKSKIPTEHEGVVGETVAT